MSKASREKRKRKKQETFNGWTGSEKKDSYGIIDLTAYNAIRHINQGGSLEDIIALK